MHFILLDCDSCLIAFSTCRREATLLLLPLLLQARGVFDPLLLPPGQRGKVCSPLFLLSSPFVEGSVWLICILIYYSPAAVAWNIRVVWLTLVAIA